MSEQNPKRMSRPDGLDKPVVTKIIKWGSAANTWLYRRTNGRLGGNWRIMAGFKKPVPVLLLTVTGRKSGEPRTVPLLYIEDGLDLIVVASTGGLPKDPQWFRNLVVTPDVSVQVGADVTPMTATVANAEERLQLWPRLVEVYDDFETYDEWTDREIPVVRLSPR